MQQMIRRPVLGAQPLHGAAPMLGGAVAGAMAGTLTAALSPLLGLVTGGGAWSVLTTLGSAGLGSAVLAGGTADALTLLAGALLMLSGAALLGAVFGLLFSLLRLTTDFGLAVYSGLGYGIVVFMLVYWGLLQGATIATSSLLLPVLVVTSSLGLFYTLLCPAPYTFRPPEH